ncbi:MAG TPA: protein kinase [Vicinamibacterales bacterium]|nr:protein kinase [Vicinamibacterales bacterium]
MIGTTLGHYQVESLLGAGGMGEVYRARDTRLGRSVAIKVLPAAFVADPDRVARFEREAKVLASLNHPHIAALFGMEEVDGRRLLLMELVEGETLADRLRRGSCSVAEALHIGRQIAEALEAAHERGVVHRDLKPANVKITPDDTVKVLDFGLAKPGAASPTDPNLADSPTLSMMASAAGVILGTAAYMSPEQAKGLPADARSDVFSFGAVFYEMLTGRQAFHGETGADVLASVLVREANLEALPPHMNPRIIELVRRCLEKHPKRRWQASGDLRAEIESIARASTTERSQAPLSARPRPMWRRALPAAVAALVAATLTGVTMWNLRPPDPPRPSVVRLSFTLPGGQQILTAGRIAVAISPDAERLAYLTNTGLFTRLLSEPEGRLLPGADLAGGLTSPMFSPDGRSILFWATDRTLRRIPVTGGTTMVICPAENPFGLSWDDRGILFAEAGKGILRVDPNGGTPQVLVALNAVKDGGKFAHGPQMLPDGETVLYTLAIGVASDRWDRANIVTHSLTSGEEKVLIRGGSDARYLPTGHLVYASGGTLYAAAFDPARLALQGEAIPILEGIRRAGIGLSTGTAQFATSSTGTLVYLQGPAGAMSATHDLALVDRKGAVDPLKLPSGSYEYPRVSPDGKRVVMSTEVGNEAIVWVYDLSATTSPRRLGFEGKNRFPMWSGDGTRIVFQSDRENDQAIFWQRADGTGAAERLTKPEPGSAHVPEAWIPKSNMFLYRVTKEERSSLWTLSVADRSSRPFSDVKSAILTTASVSPDGRWVAYASSPMPSASQSAVYVEPFPPTGSKFQVSKHGDQGHHPLWSPTGKELYYVPLPGQFVVVTVTTAPNFAFSHPTPVPRLFPVAPPTIPRPFDVTPDGRIVAPIAAGQGSLGAAPVSQLNVVFNWFEELKARVPIKPR